MMCASVGPAEREVYIQPLRSSHTEEETHQCLLTTVHTSNRGIHSSHPLAPTPY
jgi:hypothetical protein